MLRRQQEIYVTELCRAREAGEHNPELVAARVAYPKANPRSQAAIVRRWRRNRKIQAECAKRAVTDKQDLIALYLEIARDPTTGSTGRLKALDELQYLLGFRSKNGGNQRRAVSMAEQQKKEWPELPPELVAEIMETHRREDPQRSGGVFSGEPIGAVSDGRKPSPEEIAALEQYDRERLSPEEIATLNAKFIVDHSTDHETAVPCVPASPEPRVVATPVHPMLPDMFTGRSRISSEPAHLRTDDFES